MPAFEQADAELTVIVGTTTMSLSRVMSLSRGDVLSLGRSASGPVTLEANGVEFAKAEVTLVGDRVALSLPAKA